MAWVVFLTHLATHRHQKHRWNLLILTFVEKITMMLHRAVPTLVQVVYPQNAQAIFFVSRVHHVRLAIRSSAGRVGKKQLRLAPNHVKMA
jgi:hypothetical protein